MRADRRFKAGELAALFKSAGWFSGDYPEELRQALSRGGVVLSAWDGERLVGLSAVICDCGMTAYLNYLLVLPSYQGRGIGTLLLRLTLERLRGYRRIILLAEPDKQGFYRRFGFGVDEHTHIMALVNRD